MYSYYKLLPKKEKKFILFLDVAIAGLKTLMEMAATLSYHINKTDVSGNNASMYIYKQREKLRKSLYTMSLIICCLAIVLGVFGNGMVIWVTRFKMKKTVYTVWFLNFAVANFLFTASMPLRVTYVALNSTGLSASLCAN